MSKAAKQGIFILIFLLFACLGIIGYTVLQMQKIEDAKAGVEQQLRNSEQIGREQAAEISQLNSQIQQVNSEKQRVESQLKQANDKSQELNSKISSLEQETDRWKTRVEKISDERNTLVSRLDGVNKELQTARNEANDAIRKVEMAERSARDAEQKVSQMATLVKQAEQSSASEPIQQDIPVQPKTSLDMPSVVDEQYWASLLKEKASLEVSIQSLNNQLSESNIQMVELKQKNDTLSVEMDVLKAERAELDREIKYKNDLVNNLSLELARVKNNKKFVNDQLDNVTEENSKLRDQVKRLVSAKSALEKSIVRVSKDKDQMSKQLVQSESLIQNKINEIWEIKDSLTQTLVDNMKDNRSQNNEVELPPIVVSASGKNAVPFDAGMSSPGFNGKVVSLNQDNNFVIVDIGERDGIHLGETLSVYRDSKYIARLEVIQVRNDIAAADIKDQWSKIQAGDVVR